MILDLIKNEDLVLQAALVVEEHLIPNEPSPTYWHDTFETLGLV
jgi:hypothetical protein